MAVDRPSRRSFLAGGTAAVLGTALGGSLASKVAAQPPPNIVVLTIDDLWWRLGFNGGHPLVLTPNIDALAATSSRFANAHVTVPVCPASRASLMWGLSPASHGITHGKFHIPGEGMSAYYALDADPTMVTLPEVLSAAGYISMGVGKTFHVEKPSAWDMVHVPPRRAISNPGPYATYFDMGAWQAGDPDPDQESANWATARLGETHAAPFFLNVGFRLPHLPWYVPQSYLDLYPLASVSANLPTIDPDEFDDIGPIGRGQAGAPYVDYGPYGVFAQHDLVHYSGAWAEHVQAYLAAVSYVDDMVGQVMSALEAGPHAANTMVVLLSDNGYFLGNGSRWRKQMLYNDATKVPFLIRAPSIGFGSQDVDRLTSLIDFAPTICAMAGVTPPAQFEGQSLVGLPPAPTHIWTHAFNGRSAVTPTARWTFHHDEQGNLCEQEIYVNDPDETTNHPGAAEWRGPGCAL